MKALDIKEIDFKIIKKVEELGEAKLLNKGFVLIKTPLDNQIIKDAASALEEMNRKFTSGEANKVDFAKVSNVELTNKDFLIQTVAWKSTIPKIDPGTLIYVKPSLFQHVLKYEDYNISLVSEDNIYLYEENKEV